LATRIAAEERGELELLEKTRILTRCCTGVPFLDFFCPKIEVSKKEEFFMVFEVFDPPPPVSKG
jgi:hypothetical protein